MASSKSANLGSFDELGGGSTSVSAWALPVLLNSVKYYRRFENIDEN